MKKYAVLFLVLLLFVCGCSLKTYELGELIPPVLDDATLLPILQSVTVTRGADGKSVTLSGTDVETLMLCFDNIVCTREKKTGTQGEYTVSFVCTDGVEVPDLVIDKVEENYATAFEIGEYRYVTVNMTADMTYMLSLLD